MEMIEPTLEELKQIEDAGDAWSIDDFILPVLQEEESTEERPVYSEQDRLDDLLEPITYQAYLSQFMRDGTPVKNHKVFAELLMMKGLVKFLMGPGGADAFFVKFGERPPASSQIRGFVEEYLFVDKRRDKFGEENENWSDYYTAEQILEKFYDEIDGAARAVALMIEQFCDDSREVTRQTNLHPSMPLPDEENWFMAVFNPRDPIEAAAMEYQRGKMGTNELAKLHGIRAEDLISEIEERGIERLPEGRPSGDIDQAIADYVMGSSVRKAATDNKVSPATLSKTLNDLGLIRSKRKAD